MAPLSLDLSQPLTLGPGASAARSMSAPAGGFLILLRRALGLRVEPGGALPTEQAALELTNLADPHVQAFLAWRRAVLLCSAIAMIPLVLLRLIEVLSADGMPGALTAVHLLAVLAEGAFCGLLWMQLPRWTRWQAQRRTLQLGWLAMMAAPLVAYLVPVGSVVSGPAGPALGLGYSLYALLVLGPRVLAILPGLVRGSIVAKLLIPGTPAPGWLIAGSGPLTGVLIYLVFLVPFQVTGSGYFVIAMLALLGAQLPILRVGQRLARPTTHLEAATAVARARTTHGLAAGIGGLVALIAFARMTSDLHLSGLVVFDALLALAVHTLLATLIGADLLMSSLMRGDAISIDAQAAIQESEQRLATFARESAVVTTTSLR
ncbi:MAG: hypothetical protein R3B48_11825 [Kofleriaceae bacterium]